MDTIEMDGARALAILQAISKNYLLTSYEQELVVELLEMYPHLRNSVSPRLLWKAGVW